MAESKSSKKKKTKKQAEVVEGGEKITSAAELKSYLQNIRDKLTDGSAAPIYALSALNFAINQPSVYDYLNNENKEMARDIWLRLKQAGIQVKNPPLLFTPDEEDLVAPIG